MAYMSVSPFIMEGVGAWTHGRNLDTETKVNTMVLLCSPACSSLLALAFLIQAKTTCPGVALSTVSWDLPRQLQSGK